MDLCSFSERKLLNLLLPLKYAGYGAHMPTRGKLKAHSLSLSIYLIIIIIIIGYNTLETVVLRAVL